MATSRVIISGILLVVSLCASAWADLEIIEDFSNLPYPEASETSDMQHWIEYDGGLIEMWNEQVAWTCRYPVGCATVAEVGVKDHWPPQPDYEWSGMVYPLPGPGLRLAAVNEGRLEDYLVTLFLGDRAIVDQGTIYMQVRAEGLNTVLLGLNDLLPGYESDLMGDDIASGGPYQGLLNYSEQLKLLRFNAGQQSVGGGATLTFEDGQWYELWIQVDVPNARVRIYTCPAGGEAQVVTDGDGGEWFPWNNPTATAVSNLKWFVCPDMDSEPDDDCLAIDNIAVGPGLSTESLWNECRPYWSGRVTLQLFLILKSNYNAGPGATYDMGDFNGDGYVNIYDFIILKKHYGKYMP